MHSRYVMHLQNYQSANLISSKTWKNVSKVSMVNAEKQINKFDQSWNNKYISHGTRIKPAYLLPYFTCLVPPGRQDKYVLVIANVLNDIHTDHTHVVLTPIHTSISTLTSLFSSPMAVFYLWINARPPDKWQQMPANLNLPQLTSLGPVCKLHTVAPRHSSKK